MTDTKSGDWVEWNRRSHGKPGVAEWRELRLEGRQNKIWNFEMKSGPNFGRWPESKARESRR